MSAITGLLSGPYGELVVALLALGLGIAWQEVIRSDRRRSATETDGQRQRGVRPATTVL